MTAVKFIATIKLYKFLIKIELTGYLTTLQPTKVLIEKIIADKSFINQKVKYEFVLWQNKENF